jgi:Flp pilus assembly protein TadD
MALALGVHARALRGGFTTWDDDEYVTENRLVRFPTSGDLLRILDPRSLVLREWTPMVTLSFSAEHSLFGPDPLSFHVTNWLLHAATSGLVVCVLLEAGAPLVLASAAGALFGAHPLQVESVAWVSARKNLLALFFGLLSLLTYTRARRPRGYLGALALFALALGSKGTAVVVPAWLAAYRLTVGREPADGQSPWLRSLWGLLPFFALALLRGLWSIHTQADVIDRTGTLGLAGRIAVMGPVLATYLRQLFWPGQLSAHYDWPPLSFGDGRVILAWAGLAVLVGAWGVWARRDRRVAFAGLFAAIGLFPTSNLIPAPFLQADRYTHMALPGIAYLTVAAAATIGVRLRLPRPALAGAFIAWLALVLVPATWERTAVWKGGCALWRDTIQHVPQYVPARNNLGLCLLHHDDLEGAEQQFRTALSLDPGHANAWNNLGMLLLRLERPDDAGEALARAVDLQADNPIVRRNLAKAYHVRGDLVQAEQELRRSLELDPRAPITYSVLGFVLWEQGRVEEAERWLRTGLELRETPGLHNNLAWLLVEKGKPEEGAEHARRAIALRPNFAAAWDTLGVALARAGSRDEAQAAFERALSLNPELEAPRKHMQEEL